MLRRRDLFAAVGGAVVARALPVAAAQGMPTLGVMMSVSRDAPSSQARLKAFRDGLQAHGWIEGKTIRIEYRWVEGQFSTVDGLAAELLSLRPDVILANGTPVVAAMKRLTKTIPVIAALVVDPVGLGFVESLSRPGGNITGFTFINPELIGKWREILTEVAPQTKRMALLFNPKLNPFYYGFLDALGPARPGDLEITPVTQLSLDEMRAAMVVEGRAGGTSLILGPDALMVVHMKEVADLTIRNRLPAISVYRQFAAEGGLMSYGPDVPAIFRRAASYVDRVLRGENPANLPVQDPSKFELVLNARAASALGLRIPETLLATADEVIE